MRATDPDLVEWRGAGPAVWRCGPGTLMDLPDGRVRCHIHLMAAED
ncbi:hypothetical protein PV341_43875 [Streptomyces sp. PA03-1a]|nr:hypothetical protein [Streptomyces sp. PA03-1a]MDX2819288.1 hypothetical protein [Streptomyces sp. PA03-5A]